MLILFSISACGGGGGTGGGGTGGGGTGGGNLSTISTIQQASSSAAIVIQNISIVGVTADFRENIQFNPGFPSNPGEFTTMASSVQSPYTPMERALRMLARAPKIDRQSITKADEGGSHEVLCPNGGLMIFQIGIGSTVFIFNQCGFGNFEYHGTVTITENSEGNGEITYQNFSITEYSGSNPIFRTEAPNLTVTVGMEITEEGVADTLEYNGETILHDYSESESHRMIFTEYSLSFLMVNLNTTKVTVNGTIEIRGFREGERSEYFAGISYYEYEVETETRESVRLVRKNGMFAIANNEQVCFNGVFRVETLRDIVISNTTNRIIGGKIKINDNTYVTWQNDGFVVVWLDSNNNGSEDAGEPKAYRNYEEIAQFCPVYSDF